MCGIIGIASNEGTWFPEARRKMFSEMLYADAFRGQDGTGIFTVNSASENPSVEVYKKAWPAAAFLDLAVTKRIVSKAATNTFMVGHNRKATMGGYEDHHTHPFTFDNVVGVHNGTLDSHRHLPGGTGFTVDSQALYSSINEVGIKETAPNLYGAYALVWYDKKEDSLKLLRNKERPLAIGRAQNADGSSSVIFASELDMLAWIANRNNFWLTEDLVELKVGTLITIDRKTLEINKEEIKLEKPTLVSVGFSKSKSPEKPSKENIQKALKNIGLELGDTIEFTVLGLVKKKPNSRHGLLRGSMVEGEYCMVEAHGVPEALMGDTKRYKGIVTGIHFSPSGGKVIHVNNKVIPVDKMDTIDEDELKELNDNVPFDSSPYLPGPRGSYISYTDFRELTDTGCAGCGDTIYSSEAYDIVWDDTDEPICDHCAQLYGLKAKH